MRITVSPTMAPRSRPGTTRRSDQSNTVSWVHSLYRKNCVAKIRALSIDRRGELREQSW